jgi:hypothetical protein
MTKVQERDRWVHVEFTDPQQRGDIVLSGGIRDLNGKLCWGEELWSDEAKKQIHDSGIYLYQKRKYVGITDDKGNYTRDGKPERLVYMCLAKSADTPRGKITVFEPAKKLNLSVISDYIEYCYLLIQDMTVSDTYSEYNYGGAGTKRINLKDIKVDTVGKRSSYKDKTKAANYIESLSTEEIFNIAVMIGKNPINQPIDTVVIKLHEYIETASGLEYFLNNIIGKDIKHRILIEKAFAYGIIVRNSEGFKAYNIFIGADKEQVSTYLSQTDDDTKGVVIAKIKNEIKLKDREYNRSYVETTLSNMDLDNEIAKQNEAIANKSNGRRKSIASDNDKSVDKSIL